MDKNGVEKISDVYVTIGETQVEGNPIEVECSITTPPTPISLCNARILEEALTTFEPATMRYYTCTFTVEPGDEVLPSSMYGEYWVTAEVEDIDGNQATFDEKEYWFLNPTVALLVDGDIDFGTVRPGTTSYSDTLLVGNDADEGSGVLMDMFISGTDFYDSSPSGALCEGTNKLALKNFGYYAVNGAYSTVGDLEHDIGDVKISGQYSSVDRDKDGEGYVNIQYGDHWDRTMYNEAEILQAQPINGGALGYAANLLAPGAEMALTFKLNLPEPCVGNFDSGQIYFWGEAV
jgi:hypothetical protein